MKNEKKVTRIVSLILAVAIMLVSLPMMAATAAPASEYIIGEKVADPSTFDSWKELFPANNTEWAGRVWTDKSVFTDGSSFTGLTDANGNPVSIDMHDQNNNFIVALSALASNKSIVGYSYTPTDTMLVLDVSGSMSDSRYVDDLVVAANSAIAELISLNKHNRVGVVLYSGSTSYGNSSGSTATVLLPLDRYTQEDNNFLVNSGQSSVSINSGVQNEAMQGTDRYLSRTSKSVSGGTYIQNGVYMAMEEFLAVTDTVVPDGEIQAGTPKIPILVLMSDGLPTTATTNYAGQDNGQNTVGLGTSNLGDGGTPSDDNLKDAIDFVNQLTAAYALKKVDEHYADSDALFYTLGLGSNNNSLNSPVLNPSAHTNTNRHWENYVDTQNGSNLLIDIAEGWFPRQTTIKKLAEISNIAQKEYVTRYFPASNAAGLVDAFDDIVKQIIIQSLYYPTLVEGDNHDHDGFVEFRDDIGHYMEVKEIKGILLGNTFFTGERLARNFTPSGGELMGPDGTWTDMGHNVVWSVKERIGIADAQTARDLINSAYEAGQLYYNEQTGEWSNYIGWYADENGNFMGHWNEEHTEEDIPEINGKKAAYINRSYGMLGEITKAHADTDLMYISTQVHTRISDGHTTLIWKIPASLVPVVSYNITINAGNLEDATEAQIDYEAAEPIRIVFEVGLSDDITPVNIYEKITDHEAHIIDQNGDGIADDGKYHFYTNWYTGNVNHEHFPDTNDTIVFFEPSVKNERYYYSEETPVYVKSGAAYELYKGAMPASGDGRTYYRQFIVFDNDDIIREYEQISAATLGVLTAECRNNDNSWDVPAGTVHRFYEPHNVVKKQNPTDSLDYSRYSVVEDIPETDGFYVGALLGNNGMLTVDIPHGIKITKEVDETLYGTDNEYRFVLDCGTNTFGQLEAYHEAADGTLTEKTVYIRGGKIETYLKAGESIYIITGITFTVSEQINGNYKVSSVTVNGAPVAGTTATVAPAPGGFNEVVFTNTLVANDGTIIVSKEVVHGAGITFDDTKTYEFEWYNKATPNDRQTFAIKAGESKTLSGLTPGATYVVNEINIPAGFTPRNNNIEVTMPDSAAAVVPVHFINDYNPAEARPVNVRVEGTKNLIGRDWLPTDSFSFKLQVQNGAIWEDLGNERVVNSANRDYSFDFENDADINGYSFGRVGNYHFRVIEVIPQNAQGGMTYDDTYHYFTVYVTDKDMDGKLEIDSVTSDLASNISQNGNTWIVDADYKNVYAPTHSDELVITIDKTVTDNVGTNKGREGFIFGLFTVDGTAPIVSSKPTDANGHTTIELTFPANAAGREYNFEIREIVPDEALGGMTYDDTAHPVKIKVVDNLDGTVSAIVETGAGEREDITVGFENVYDPADVSVTLGGIKEMTGRECAAGEFTFELRKEGENTALTAANTASVNGKATFTFAELTFDKVGTYRYTLSEKRGSALGVTYSGKVYDIEIIVSDDTDNDGRLNALVKIDGVETAAADIADTLVFTNSYAPVEGDSVEIIVDKTVTDKVAAGITAEGFTFGIYEAGTENLIKSGKTDASGALVFTLDFEALSAGKEFAFELREIAPANKLLGMTYDDTVYTFSVKVTDNLDGTVIAKIVTAGGEADSFTAEFENIYDPADVKVVLSGTKVMDGREFDADEFTFELLENGAAAPMVSGNTASASNKAGFLFELAFEKVGVYSYTLTEKGGNKGGVTYSDKTYAIEITVSDDADNDGTLNASVKVDGVIIAGNETADTLVFENIYSVSPGTIKLFAKKLLDGRDLVSGEFSFELYDANMALLETVKNTADGAISFSNIAADKAGEYIFYIREAKGEAEHVTYDERVYKVIVTVTDNGEGEFDIEYAYEVSSAAAEEIVFTNSYNPPAPPAPPVPSIPQTGDHSNINLWLALFLVSGGLLGVSLFSGKRKSEEN